MVYAVDKNSSFSISAARPSTISRFTYGKLLLFMYRFLFFVSALGAYNISFVPIDWLIKIGLIAVVVFVAYSQRLYTVPGSRILFAFFFWALLVTALSSMFNDYASMMPPLATTPYSVFISLRFLNILSFIAALYLVYWLLVNGYRDSVIKWTAIIGMFFALFAVYIYFAQIYGFPEPPRNRMGTSGGMQIVRFSYAFHRGQGTFREPSHLAEWLVIPFFLGMIYRKRSVNIYSSIIGGVILLTGSLTAIMGGLLGSVGAMLVMNPFRRENMKTLLSFLIVGLVSLLVFNMLAVSYGIDRPDIMKVVTDRLESILFEGGMQQSSRGQIYRYIADTTFPLFGSGIGNANIIFADYLGGRCMAAFNSTYFGTLYSTGFVGFTLVIYFLSVPIRQWRWRKKLKNDTNFRILCTCYLSWLIMAAGHSDIFSMSFAIIFCLIVYELRQYKQIREVKRRCVL